MYIWKALFFRKVAFLLTAVIAPVPLALRAAIDPASGCDPSLLKICAKSGVQGDASVTNNDPACKWMVSFTVSARNDSTVQSCTANTNPCRCGIDTCLPPQYSEAAPAPEPPILDENSCPCSEDGFVCLDSGEAGGESCQLNPCPNLDGYRNQCDTQRIPGSLLCLRFFTIVNITNVHGAAISGSGSGVCVLAVVDPSSCRLAGTEIPVSWPARNGDRVCCSMQVTTISSQPFFCPGPDPPQQ